jgi:small subunit ribosomal protein SAe
MPDLYLYRDPEEIEKEEQAAAEKAVTKEEFQGEWTAPAPEFTAAQPDVADWSEGVQVPSVPIQQFLTEDWSAQSFQMPTNTSIENLVYLSKVICIDYPALFKV